MNTQERDLKIDILRSIGLGGIILSHVGPPVSIMNLRTFDVVLMVIVSGLSYGNRQKTNIAIFYKKRMLRLLAPVWCFLLIYFSYFYVVGKVIGAETISLPVVLNSFLLFNSGGIGYLWIIRVFLLVALTSPFILKINAIIKNDSVYLFVFLLGLLSYTALLELKRSLFLIHSDFLPLRLMQEYAFYAIPYSIIFAIGVRIKKMMENGRQLYITMLTVFSFFVTYIIVRNSHFMNFYSINNYKYPPQGVWISYGIACSFLLFTMLDYVRTNKYIEKAIVFISSTSIWIYLWHIFILKNISYGSSHIPDFINLFYIKFFMVFGISCLLVYFQRSFVEFVIRHFSVNEDCQSFLKVTFLK